MLVLGLLLGAFLASGCERRAAQSASMEAVRAEGAPSQESWDTTYDVLEGGQPRVRMVAGYMARYEQGDSTFLLMQPADSIGERVRVHSPEDVAAVYGPLMRDLKREVFRVVMLNTANVVVGDYTVSEGGLAASIVEPRAVFQQAVLDNAAAIICLHNHPSGNPEPSREDVRITRRLAEAGRLMGIPLHDHLIIAGTGFTSLAERGVIA